MRANSSYLPNTFEISFLFFNFFSFFLGGGGGGGIRKVQEQTSERSKKVPGRYMYGTLKFFG